MDRRGARFANTHLHAIVRHPAYAAWILFVLPGLALVSRSWFLLMAPVVAWVGFKLSIRWEDTALDSAFGDTYRAYRSQVGELVPSLQAMRSRAKGLKPT